MITALASTPLALHGYGPWGYGGHVGFPFFFVAIPLFWIAVIVVVGLLFGRRWRRAAAWRAQYGPGPWGRGFGGPWGHGAYGQGGYGQAGYGAGPWGPPASSAAEQVLSDRFARGDIDEVEYRARLEVLRAGQQPPMPQGPQAPGTPQGPGAPQK